MSADRTKQMQGNITALYAQAIFEQDAKLRAKADAMVKDFVDALVKAGQRAEYVQVGGASHAFFDWKPDNRTKATFAQYGPVQAAGMEAFFNSIFYPAAK